MDYFSTNCEPLSSTLILFNSQLLGLHFITAKLISFVIITITTESIVTAD